MSRFDPLPDMPWTIDRSINVDRISIDELKLIFNQAEKRLDDTIRQGEGIASKTMSIVTLITIHIIKNIMTYHYSVAGSRP
ncbi:MAG TPA: hypothetical protein VHW43_06455 [Puia sp.]|nr:hypothetical protein [Puia sp.]